MEYRKLISFGKSSFVVSLPKSWVVQNKLKKGDLISFDELGNSLQLFPREAHENNEEEKEFTIAVDGKNLEQIQREVIPAYINNYKTIILRGKELKEKAVEINKIIQNLIALEIMEQTSDKIVARDFLDMRDISISNLIRKMDTIIRAMIQDSVQTFKEDNYENIMHRDKDVNRISYLVFRVVKYGLNNQTFLLKKYKLNVLDLFNYQWLVTYLEAIADEVKRTSRYMRLSKKLPDKEKKEFERLYSEVMASYLDTMKAYHTNNISLAHSIAGKRPQLIQACEDFFLRNASVQWVGHLTDRLKRMLSDIHHLGRIIYQ